MSENEEPPRLSSGPYASTARGPYEKPLYPYPATTSALETVQSALESRLTVWAVLVCVGLMCCLCNLVLPRVWWRGPGTNETLFLSTMMTALGCLSAEFGALGVWFGAGKQNLLLRVLITTTIAFILSAVYALGLGINDSMIPVWAIILLLCIGTIGQVIVGTVLLGVSNALQLKIGHRQANATSQSVRVSDIRTIAIITAVVALVTTIIKGLLSLTDERMGGGGPPVGAITDAILMMGQGALICAVVLGSLILLLLYDNRNALFGLLGLAVVLVVLIPINFVVVHYAYRSLNVDAEFVLYYYSFMLGFSGLTALFCLLGRLTGFRLVEAETS